MSSMPGFQFYMPISRYCIQLNMIAWHVQTGSAKTWNFGYEMMVTNYTAHGWILQELYAGDWWFRDILGW